MELNAKPNMSEDIATMVSGRPANQGVNRFTATPVREHPTASSCRRCREGAIA
jgi:hypothetical protein